MSGKDKFQELFERQIVFQNIITQLYYLPKDDIEWASYHMLALTEELGELLKSDKRWKTHRNEHYDPNNKLEEIADCIITLMNISMFSGLSAECILKAIEKKIYKNFEKIESKKEVIE